MAVPKWWHMWTSVDLPNIQSFYHIRFIHLAVISSWASLYINIMYCIEQDFQSFHGKFIQAQLGSMPVALGGFS